MAGLDSASRYAVANGTPDPKERWKTAPFIMEWCESVTPEGPGTMESALGQVKSNHVTLLSSRNYTGPLTRF
ncbi:hypothetical protein, partial [Campylobacter jejuni]|uniref:hypothetical protein n=1 Tax=Campylobacter jejuni TaxID=197 RepID=UPI0028F322BC